MEAFFLHLAQIGCAKEIVVFLSSMFPIWELKGAIILGQAWGLSPWVSYALSLAGSSLSAVILLQSEHQLEAIYHENAAVIRQNCAVYAYFPGGFDDRSCEIVSKRMGVPYEEILYAPLGNVYIMQSGRKPVFLPRYDTLHSPEYQEYLEFGIQADRKR